MFNNTSSFMFILNFVFRNSNTGETNGDCEYDHGGPASGEIMDL